MLCNCFNGVLHFLNAEGIMNGFFPNVKNSALHFAAARSVVIPVSGRRGQISPSAQRCGRRQRRRLGRDAERANGAGGGTWRWLVPADGSGSACPGILGEGALGRNSVAAVAEMRYAGGDVQAVPGREGRRRHAILEPGAAPAYSRRPRALGPTPSGFTTSSPQRQRLASASRRGGRLYRVHGTPFPRNSESCPVRRSLGAG